MHDGREEEKTKEEDTAVDCDATSITSSQRARGIPTGTSGRLHSQCPPLRQIETSSSHSFQLWHRIASNGMACRSEGFKLGD